MNTTTCTPTAPRSLLDRAVRYLARLVGAVADGLSRQAMNRRVLHQLAAMSERDLRDIGLVPQDVEDACLPENGDPSLFLIARRGERRGSRGLTPRVLRHNGAIRFRHAGL
jgi:uncharacterized protein YjiS (DUF1127 family)